MSRNSELILALGMGGFALFAALVWIPGDTETGLIESYRRQTFLGDAFVPTLAAWAIVIASAVQVVVVWRRPDPGNTIRSLKLTVVGFFLVLCTVVICSVLIMLWAGPLAVEIFGPTQDNGEAATYRQLRSTWPWKYIGFLLGGFAMVFGISTLIEGRMSWKRAGTSALAVILLIAIFDLPFDAILLPPNGDW